MKIKIKKNPCKIYTIYIYKLKKDIQCLVTYDDVIVFNNNQYANSWIGRNIERIKNKLEEMGYKLTN